MESSSCVLRLTQSLLMASAHSLPIPPRDVRPPRPLYFILLISLSYYSLLQAPNGTIPLILPLVIVLDTFAPAPRSPRRRRHSPLYAPPRPPRPIPAQVHQRPMLARRAVECAHAAQHPRLGREGAQPRFTVLPVRVRHEVVPQPRSQMWPHLPREARGGRGDERAPPLLGAPPREALQRGACAAAPAGRRGGGGRGGRRESWRGERRGGR